MLPCSNVSWRPSANNNSRGEDVDNSREENLEDFWDFLWLTSIENGLFGPFPHWLKVWRTLAIIQEKHQVRTVKLIEFYSRMRVLITSTWISIKFFVKLACLTFDNCCRFIEYFIYFRLPLTRVSRFPTKPWRRSQWLWKSFLMMQLNKRRVELKTCPDLAKK